MTLIREAKPSDAPAIAIVHVDSWRTTYPGIFPEDWLSTLSYAKREELWTTILTQPGIGGSSLVLVAEDQDGRITGFASGGPERSGDPDYQAELYALYLLESAQRKGLGRRLFEAFVDALIRSERFSLLVWVAEGNPACRFYEAMGGKPVKTKEESFGDHLLTELGYGWPDIRRINGKRTSDQPDR